MPNPRPAPDDGTFRIALAPDQGGPAHRQIVDQVWEAVYSGTLPLGQRLPTVRQLAIDLGVHPDTVARAYAELELLGVVDQRRGEGTFVGLKAADSAELGRRRRLEILLAALLDEIEPLGFTVDDVIGALALLRKPRRHADNEEGSS